MGTQVTSSSGSVLEEPEIQKLQIQAKIFKENSLNKLNALKSTTQLLEQQSILYQQAFAQLFGDSFRTFTFQLSQHMNNLETLLNAETLHEMDSKSALSVIKVQFERFINSDLLKPLDIYSRSFSSDREVKEIFRDYTTMTAQTFKETIIQNMNSIEQCIIERASHEQELQITLKKLSERQLQIQKCKVQEDVLPAESSSTNTPLEQVQINDEKNVFANERQHSEKHDAECVDERDALANLIANLTLDTEENKTILKQLKKANASLTQELEKCKTNRDETNILDQKHNDLVKKSLLTKSQLEGYLKENTKVISDLKVKEEKDIDKMIEDGTNRLNPEKPVGMRIPFDRLLNPAQTDFGHLKGKDQVDSDNKSRSKLDKDTVKPYDYTRQNKMASSLVKRFASNLMRVRTMASSSRLLNTNCFQYDKCDNGCILKCDDRGRSLVRGLVHDAFDSRFSPTTNLTFLLNLMNYVIGFKYGHVLPWWNVVEDDKALYLLHGMPATHKEFMNEFSKLELKESVPRYEFTFAIHPDDVKDSVRDMNLSFHLHVMRGGDSEPSGYYYHELQDKKEHARFAERASDSALRSQLTTHDALLKNQSIHSGGSTSAPHQYISPATFTPQCSLLTTTH
ncbi:hypothetical protein Tco_0037790 [Tanacetum coccineum]